MLIVERSRPKDQIEREAKGIEGRNRAGDELRWIIPSGCDLVKEIGDRSLWARWSGVARVEPFLVGSVSFVSNIKRSEFHFN
jgi:hypothetical protein